MVWGMFSWYFLDKRIILKGIMDQHKYHLALWTMYMYTPTCELVFVRAMTCTSRKMGRIIQIAVYMHPKRARMSLPYSTRHKSKSRISGTISFGLFVVRAMDSQPRNLAQLATARETAWLRIKVNTYKNLNDYILARIEAIHTSKRGYPGFCQVVSL